MGAREQLVEMARANIAHTQAGTVNLADGVYRVPTANYADPDRWRLEVDRIFKRVPLMLGFSAELREANSYKAIDVAGVPVLIARQPDGSLRTFVNMCSHRGATIVEPGCGEARRFTCPYHAWSYSQAGDLVGVLDRHEFGDIDTAALGLSTLPVIERAGLIWVSLTPGNPNGVIDIDQYLCGYDELLAEFHLKDWHYVGRRTVEGPNWKVAYDGYLDFYHLPILHKHTFGPKFPNRAIYNAWGPHQRVTSPGRHSDELAERPESEWTDRDLLGGVWTIFPHISIASFDVGASKSGAAGTGPRGAGTRGVLVSQLFPGDTPETSITVQNFLLSVEPTAEQLEATEKQMDFLEFVVREEDYFTGNRITRNLKVAAKTEVLFGRNEGGGQRFHQWVDRLVAAEDSDLTQLFTSNSDASEHGGRS
jgi:carnitine monooxygenase subunit